MSVLVYISEAAHPELRGKLLATMSVPVYISEDAPPELRGKLKKYNFKNTLLDFFNYKNAINFHLLLVETKQKIS